MSDEVLDELEDEYDDMCKEVDSIIEEDAELQSYLRCSIHRCSASAKHLVSVRQR